jgi:hypothetical protein
MYVTYIPLTLYPVGVAEASQIFLRDVHVLPKYLAMSNTADVTGGKNTNNVKRIKGVSME